MVTAACGWNQDVAPISSNEVVINNVELAVLAAALLTQCVELTQVEKQQY